VINAAAAIYVAGLADSLNDGIELAERSIDGGGASDALVRLREAAKSAAGAAA
jgi:anthranilate phosphoribosyltransferase